MTHTTTNTLEIQAPVANVYDYVTQPWRWHEWHPSSKSATESKQALVVGDTFDEVVEVQPLAPLPLNLRRQTHYNVLIAEPGKLWEVRGQMHDAWLQIRYEFSPTATGTQFTRTLIYATSGPSRLLMPLLKRRMAVVSVIALGNLKRKLER